MGKRGLGVCSAASRPSISSSIFPSTFLEMSLASCGSLAKSYREKEREPSFLTWVITLRSPERRAWRWPVSKYRSRSGRSAFGSRRISTRETPSRSAGFGCPTNSARVGNTSWKPIGVELTEAAGIWPSQRATKGTRMPPSHRDVLKPRNSPFDSKNALSVPPLNVAPLSLVKITRVFLPKPSSSTLASNRPSPASMRVTMAAYAARGDRWGK